MVKKTKNIQYYEAVGRRKEAVARVRLYLTAKEKQTTVGDLVIKEGEIFVNKKPIETIYSHAFEKAQYLRPLQVSNSEKRFAISIITAGGGKSGQLEAISHGLARAIEKVDKDTYRPILKKEGLLTRDPRTRERRSVGTGGKARRQKQSPKR